MVRASKIEMCMFCNEVPCKCNAPEPKVRKPRTAKVVTEQQVQDTLSAYVEERRPAGPFAGFKSPTEQLREMQITTLHEQLESVSVFEPHPLEVLVDFGIVTRTELEHALEEKLPVRPRHPATDSKVTAWKRGRNAQA